MGKINKINVSAVEEEIKLINNYIIELNRLCSNIDSDITRGWNRSVVRSLVTPKNDEIKDNLSIIERSIDSVSRNAYDFAEHVSMIDES